ncbi:MAG: hypothetical protein V5A55_14770 [Halovenus sp.]
MRALYDALADRTGQFVILNYEGSADRLEAIRRRLASTGVATRTAATERGEPVNAGVFYDDNLVDAVDIDEWWPETVTVERVLEGEGGIDPPAIPGNDGSVVVSPEATRDRLVGVSRQFEERALRCGGGRLAVGFQNLSVLADSPRTREVYDRLASTGVDVSVHGYPDADVRDVDYDIVPDTEGQFREYWFMLYDGDGDPDRKAVLVALEHEDGIYDGYWSVDPAVVDDAFDIVRDAYPTLFCHS